MATTFSIAVDQIYGRLKEHWNANAGPVTGASPTPKLYYEDMNWPGRPNDPDESSTLPWGRVTIRHNTGVQATLGGTEGRLFRHGGRVFVQVFASWEDQDAAAIARLLATVAKDAFEGRSTPDVWFRQVTIEEKGVAGAWYQINVVARFEWDERK